MICPCQSLKGHLLVAGPGLVDPNFRRSVVLVGDHGEEGALGVDPQPRLRLDGRRGGAGARDALADGMRRRSTSEVPVQPSAIVVLADFVEPDRAQALVLEVIGFLPAEIDPDVLGELRRARIFAGYAGWGPGQLDGELEEGSWIVEPATRRTSSPPSPTSSGATSSSARAARSASSR